MIDRLNKTSICSIVFLDIIDYSKKPDSEQIDVKNQFNAFINDALKDIAQNDRIILDTGDGAAIAYMGSPEDALFMALNIRDNILKNNESGQSLIHLRFGINLGPVRVVKDINGRPNIIGDGINVAQRIMSFAEPNQILVSRSYYEVTSRLTQEISKMFDYSGVKHDKHVREHEVYSVRLSERRAKVENQAEVIIDNSPFKNQFAVFNKINWNYAAPAVFVLVTLFAIGKLAFAPSMPANISKMASNSVSEKAPSAQAHAADILPVSAAAVVHYMPTNIKPGDIIPANNVVANNRLDYNLLETTMLENKAPEDQILEDNKNLLEQKAANKLSKKKAKQKDKKLQKLVPERIESAHNIDRLKDQIPKSANFNAQATLIADSKISQHQANHEVVKVIEKSSRIHQCSQAQVAMGQCN